MVAATATRPHLDHAASGWPRWKRAWPSAQAAMRPRIAATRRFYAQLDPAAEEAFDALPTLMMGAAAARR